MCFKYPLTAYMVTRVNLQASTLTPKTPKLLIIYILDIFFFFIYFNVHSTNLNYRNYIKVRIWCILSLSWLIFEVVPLWTKIFFSRCCCQSIFSTITLSSKLWIVKKVFLEHPLAKWVFPTLLDYALHTPCFQDLHRGNQKAWKEVNPHGVLRIQVKITACHII